MMLLLYVLLAVSIADSAPKYPERSKYFQELGASYALGGIGWCIGATAGYWIWETFDAAAIGGFSLYGLGASMGVWLVGQKYDEGNYFWTVVGTAALPLLLNDGKKLFKIKSEGYDIYYLPENYAYDSDVVSYEAQYKEKTPNFLQRLFGGSKKILFRDTYEIKLLKADADKYPEYKKCIETRAQLAKE